MLNLTIHLSIKSQINVSNLKTFFLSTLGWLLQEGEYLSDELRRTKAIPLIHVLEYETR